MGEFLPDPHATENGKGASADVGKYLQAAALAAQLGKTVEEVLAFLGTSKPIVTSGQIGIPAAVEQPLPNVLSEEILAIPEELVEEVKSDAKAKAVSPKKEAIPDETGFVVTETVDAADATEAELDEAIPPEEEENDWSGKIREGSKVKITWQAPGSKIKWEGKKGKVIRVIGNENAKVYEVEFAAGKVAKTRLNKKTGKLERGYITKKFQGTFSEDQIELIG